MAIALRQSRIIPLTSTSATTVPVVVGLLLDTYPNALVGFSFRKLRSAYAGSAVRIRRSSDNAEADIGFSGNNFDSAAAATHIGGGSGFIVTWYDQSGSGYDITNTTAADQPAYVASGIGAKPCMNHIATDYLLNATGSMTLSSSVLSCFAIAIMDTSAPSYARLVSLRGSSSGADYDSTNSAFVIARKSTNDEISSYRNADKSFKAVTVGTAYRMATIFDGTNHTMYVNASGGTPVASTGTFGNPNAQISVGHAIGDPTGPWVGQDSEVVIWAADQTSNLSGIDSNQSTYYGI